MIKVIVIVGPTGVGKSLVGIELALHLNGEIISGDAMQVYKGMTIGTAKVTPEEQRLVRHHLIDEVDIHESFDVARFQLEVRKAIQDIHNRGKQPILVGGTGLYLKAALYDYTFSAEDPIKIKQVRQTLENQTTAQLYDSLSNIDYKSALAIGSSNHRRLLRALEIYHLTGQTKSGLEEKQAHLPLYDVTWIGLTMDRILLHERQNKRIEMMIKNGLIEEVKALFGPTYTSTFTSTQAIGYKELFPYLLGQISLEEAIRQIEIHTHQYTKRQMTWFRHQVPVQWFEVDGLSLQDVQNQIYTWIKEGHR